MIAGWCIGLVILAFILHNRKHVHHRAQQEDSNRFRLEDVMEHMQSQEMLASRIKSTRVFQSLEQHGPTKTKGMMSEIDADIHERCNPSLPRSELSFVDTDSVFSPKSGVPEYQCGQHEAAVLRAALDTLDYSCAAVTPEPFMHAPMMEPVFRYLNRSQLVQAIAHASDHLKEKVKNTQLTSLVKFFAWGWPVEASELHSALGSAAIKALKQCGLVMPCSKVPNYWISSLMLFPAPNTSAIVATDWGVRNITETHEASAPSVSLETLKLMHSGPDVQSKHVLDLSLNGGFQAIVAAQRGAESAVVLETGPRTVRIARFNAWINGVGDKVRVDRLDAGDALPSTFNVMFGHGQAQSLHATLGAGVWHLAPQGTFAITMDTQDPQELATQLCSGFQLSGFRGFVSHEQRSTPPAPYPTMEAYIVSGWRTQESHTCNFQVSHTVVAH